MRIVSVQDISCFGQCSLTVAQPVLSSYGIETAILPSAILSTHTGGFKNFVVHDLTDEMPAIVNHWKAEGLKFDGIYTGYIGDARQFDIIMNMKKQLLAPDGLFFVDPAMADHGRMYYGLGSAIADGMRKLCSEADYILPNMTEAAFLTGTEYREEQSEEYTDELLEKLHKLGAKNIVLTGVEKDGKLGAAFYNGKEKTLVVKERKPKSYHGTGDIFSSLVIAGILNKKDVETVLNEACDFVLAAITETEKDPDHWYGVKFEEVLKKK